MSNQAFSAGSALQPAAIARIRRSISSRLLSHQAERSASSLTVTGATSAWACAMLRAIVRRTPRRTSSGPSSRKIRATRSTSRTVTVSFGPLGVTIARSTSSLRASARTAGVALTADAPARPAGVARSRATSSPFST